LLVHRSTMVSWRQYPSPVFFILGNELCERFSFYGMKALLTVYLVTDHHFIPSNAVLFYHLFSCIAYLSPLLGSIAADSYFGRYNVILYVSMFYVCGHGLLSFGALPWLDYYYRSFFDFSGLIVIALSTGGIKPCVSAFAVDQFGEDQEAHRSQFFSFFYFSINAGALLAILTTPIFKSKVKCFGSDTCFPLAFGVPGVLMLIALIIFVAGSRFYKRIRPRGSNVASQLLSCASVAIHKKWKGETCVEGGDWISLAASEHSLSTIRSLRSFIAVSTVFAPIVLFWALFDQKGSTWILLARKLNYRFGSVSIIPEQINFLNPLLILILVPIFEGVVYPLARKIVRVTPLRKMATGGILTAVSFILCGLIQLEADKDAPPFIGEREVLIYHINNDSILDEGIVNVNHLPSYLNENDTLGGKGVVASNVERKWISCLFDNKKEANGGSRLVVMMEEESLNITIRTSLDVIVSGVLSHCDGVLIPSSISKVTVEWISDKWSHSLNSSTITHQYDMVETGVGSVQALHFTRPLLHTKTLVKSNQVSIAWMFPQYVVITMGEVLLSVTGLEFAYSQADPHMKSIMQALWLMTVFLGNLIDAMISGSHFVTRPAHEFFFYAFLMLIVMIIFIFLAVRYKSQSKTKEDNEDLNNIQLLQSK
ncbi:hypothetical protein PFISCL1PPCAC_19998, partial [Pristionchus fissidentatus]